MPETFAGLELRTYLSVVTGVEEFLPSTFQPSKKKKKQFLRDSSSPRNLGGLLLYPFFMLRRQPPVFFSSRDSPRASSKVNLPGGTRSEQRPTHRATGNAAYGAHRSPDRQCDRRTSEQHGEPPPPPPPPPSRPLPASTAPQLGAGTRA